MEDIFFLNRLLIKILQSATPEFLANRLLNSGFFNSEYIKRVRPDLLEQIKKVIDIEKIKYLNIKFEPVTEDIGKTYALFVSNRNEKSLCLILKVEFNGNSTSESPEFYGSASSFETNFKSCFEYILKIIQDNLKEAFFYPDIIKNLGMKFLTPLNEPVNSLNLYGNSLEFPLCVAIFSALVNEKIDISIACSGNVTEDLKIRSVDGVEEKIEAAVTEYPEIKKIVLPEDCKDLKLEEKYSNVKIEYVSTLEEGLKVFYPNYKELIEGKNFNGKFGIKDEEVELDNGERAVKIYFDFDYSLTLRPDILKIIYRPIENILKKYAKPGINSFLLNNFRPTWLIAALMKIFINKSSVVAVYDTSGYYVVVYERNANSNLGRIIRTKP